VKVLILRSVVINFIVNVFVHEFVLKADIQPLKCNIIQIRHKWLGIEWKLCDIAVLL
jgi:hypothetical protein